MAAAKSRYEQIHFISTDHVRIVLDALYRLEALIESGDVEPWTIYQSKLAISDPLHYGTLLAGAIDKFNEVIPGPMELQVEAVEVHHPDSPISNPFWDDKGERHE